MTGGGAPELLEAAPGSDTCKLGQPPPQPLGPRRGSPGPETDSRFCLITYLSLTEPKSPQGSPATPEKLVKLGNGVEIILEFVAQAQ